jgi:hypothetical protein
MTLILEKSKRGLMMNASMMMTTENNVAIEAVDLEIRRSITLLVEPEERVRGIETSEFELPDAVLFA